jgi:hypothetical protein
MPEASLVLQRLSTLRLERGKSQTFLSQGWRNWDRLRSTSNGGWPWVWYFCPSQFRKERDHYGRTSNHKGKRWWPSQRLAARLGSDPVKRQTSYSCAPPNRRLRPAKAPDQWNGMYRRRGSCLGDGFVCDNVTSEPFLSWQLVAHLYREPTSENSRCLPRYSRGRRNNVFLPVKQKAD